MNFLAIFIGGGAGSLARYGLHKWLGISEKGFPVGTLAANIAACLLLGIIATWAAKKTDLDPALRNLLMVGFCGGFSTFSTFSNESFVLFQNEKSLMALAYIAASVVLCLLAVWVGSYLAHLFTR